MAKPTTLPRWAEEVDGTPAINIVEPNAGKKSVGFTTGGDVPTSGGLNWFMRLVYKWCEWLNTLLDEAHTWSEQQTFSAGVAATGVGSVAGVHGTGSPDGDSAGVLGTANGDGTGPGVKGVGDGYSHGVVGEGAGASYGVHAISNAGGNSPDYPAIVAEGHEWSPAIKAIGGAISGAVVGETAANVHAIWGKCTGAGAGIAGESTSGPGGTFKRNATYAAVILDPNGSYADPSNPVEGSIWLAYNGSKYQVKVHVGNQTQVIWQQP